MKKVLLLIGMLMLLCTTCVAAETMAEKVANAQFDASTAKRIVVFLDAPMTYADNEKIRTLVPAKSKLLFPRPKYDLVPYDDAQMALKIYREEHDMTINNYTVKNLKIADIQALGKGAKADYAMVLIVRNSYPRVSSGFMSVSFKTTVTCDIRILNVTSGQYVLSKQIVKDGTSTSYMGGIPSFDNAYSEALEKALSEVQVDHAKLE